MRRTEAELRKCLKKAWPVECMAAHGAADRTIEEIGFIHGEYDRWCKLYEDDKGDFWYKSYIETERGILPEEEAIFGRRVSRKRA